MISCMHNQSIINENWRFSHEVQNKLMLKKSVYLPWLICKVIGEWKFGWTIWYHRLIEGWKIFDYLQVSEKMKMQDILFLLLISVIVAYLRLAEKIQSFWIFKISVCFLITIISIHVIIHKMRVRKHKLQWPRFSLSFTNWDTNLSDNTFS